MTTFTLQAVAVGPAGLDRDDPTVSVRYSSHVPMPLHTGRRRARSRAEHARVLAMGRYARRRERRHGIPACTYQMSVYLPRARVTAGP